MFHNSLGVWTDFQLPVLPIVEYSINSKKQLMLSEGSAKKQEKKTTIAGTAARNQTGYLSIQV